MKRRSLDCKGGMQRRSWEMWLQTHKPRVGGYLGVGVGVEGATVRSDNTVMDRA